MYTCGSSSQVVKGRELSAPVADSLQLIHRPCTMRNTVAKSFRMIISFSLLSFFFSRYQTWWIFVSIEIRKCYYYIMSCKRRAINCEVNNNEIYREIIVKDLKLH